MELIFILILKHKNLKDLVKYKLNIQPIDLNYVLKYLNISPYGYSHDALNDSINTALIFKKIRSIKNGNKIKYRK